MSSNSPVGFRSKRIRRSPATIFATGKQPQRPSHASAPRGRRRALAGEWEFARLLATGRRLVAIEVRGGRLEIVDLTTNAHPPGNPDRLVAPRLNDGYPADSSEQSMIKKINARDFQHTRPHHFTTDDGWLDFVKISDYLFAMSEPRHWNEGH